ncbi:MAG TPA: ATP-binding protein [Lacunisphaera sp.]
MSAKSRPDIDHVPGEPAKNFFVNMLTRDIELKDAVLDLLDNCVDGALRTLSEQTKKKKRTERTGKPLDKFWAKITLKPDRFVIEDNCGGIPWKLAHDYAFRMGKPSAFERAEGTIGMVGIGMKRAIFKIGRECFVHSNHEDETFLVTIEPQWFKENGNWDFPAEREKPHSKNFGTIIEITQLNEAVAAAFEPGSTFRKDFLTRIGESYSYLIDKGFSITVNDAPVERKAVKVFFETPTNKPKWGGLIQPYVFSGRYGDVDVFFAIGYRTSIQTAEEIDADKEAAFAAKHAGWTVVCNDRVVVSNDQSILTGWGFGGVPGFHTQFSAIAGIVEFRSENTFDLPLTTTKRGLESSKPIYTIVRSRMQEALKYFTRHTNRWKGREEELKDHFRKLEKEAQGYDLTGLKEMATEVRMSPSANMPGFRVFKPSLPEKGKISSVRRVSFVKPIAEITMVSQFLFDEEREASEVGQNCFERTLDEARSRRR